MERHLHPVVASLRDGTATLHKYVDMKLHERLLDLLKSLMRGTTAKEFLKPVELPGYSQIILQPMDLGRNAVRPGCKNDTAISCMTW
jgi:hypothetical protein